MSTLKEKIESYINPKGLIKTPAHYVKEILSDMVDKIDETVDKVDETIDKSIKEINLTIELTINTTIDLNIIPYVQNKIVFDTEELNIDTKNGYYYNNNLLENLKITKSDDTVCPKVEFNGNCVKLELPKDVTLKDELINFLGLATYIINFDNNNCKIDRYAWDLDLSKYLVATYSEGTTKLSSNSLVFESLNRGRLLMTTGPVSENELLITDVGTKINNYAFYECSGLKSVVIPNSVNSIGEYAFSSCSGLTSVEIPNSVTSIESYAFAYCSGLKSVVIPNSVNSIGKMAFEGCSGLTSVVIPNSVTSIGNEAFSYCPGLTSVEIGNSVTSIGKKAFYYCTGLTTIVVDENNSKYDSREDCNAIIETETNTLISGCKNTIIPDSVTSIGEYAFSRCELTSITIPNSVTSIGSSAFLYCSGLTSVIIGNSVTSIGSSAFKYCSGLTSVIWNAVNYPNCRNDVSSPFYDTRYYINSFEFGDSVKHIPAYMCYGMSNLTSVVIPNSVTSIGSSVFSGCAGLTSIIVDGGNPKYDSREDCNAIIETETNTLIYGCKNTIIPNSVNSIGYRAFYDCWGLTSIEIPNSVTSIGNSAFSDCTGLTSVEIGDSVKSIGEYAFYGCSGLTSITIPDSVKSISYSVFRDCYGLTSVVWDAVNCYDFSKYDYSPFYERRTGVTSFEFGDNVEHIPGYVCYGMSNLTSVVIPDSVTSIGSYAFRSCSGLTSIIVDENNPIYDSREDCNAIIKTETNTLILGCKNTIIHDSVTSIGEYAFYGCSGLTSITIPNLVTSIESYAFGYCSGLISIIMSSIVPPSLGSNVFYETPSNLIIYVPDESVDTYKTNWSGYSDKIKPLSEKPV